MTEPWQYIVLAFGLWFFIYVAFRLAGAAWFQSKMDHFRRVMTYTKGEDNDGKE